MDDDAVQIAELKTGQQLSLDIGSREVVLTKLEEPHRFRMDGWFPEEKAVYIMQDQIEEDQPLHYAFEPMTLEEGMKRNEGKFGKNLVMYDFLGREVEGIEMEEEDEAATEG